MRAAVYARVSISNGSQTCENQLLELRRYCEARGWTVHAEYTDEMSGARDHRPGLDRLLLDARRTRFGVVVCWALDRVGRDLKHLLAVLEDLQSLNIPFVSLKEGLDFGSASGRLLLEGKHPEEPSGARVDTSLPAHKGELHLRSSRMAPCLSCGRLPSLADGSELRDVELQC